MSDPLYKKELLRLAADAHGAGRLSKPDATGDAFNPACGDKVTIDIALDETGGIAALASTVTACVLAQASASILGRSAAGAVREDVENLANDIATMLISDGNAPASPFAAYGEFRGATQHRNRHRCVLLPLDALLNAFDKAETR